MNIRPKVSQLTGKYPSGKKVPPNKYVVYNELTMKLLSGVRGTSKSTAYRMLKDYKSGYEKKYYKVI